MDKDLLWEKCASFHGHTCGGLAIGFRAALYAIKLLDIEFSKDEEIVCITENDACGVDAIQAVLGCSVGKGNLLFRMRGKQAFSFYNRNTGKSVRLVLRPQDGLTRDKSMDFYLSHSDEEIFEVKDVQINLPEKAKIYESVKCECCGENTMESMIRLENGKKLCLECFIPYTRFLD